MTSNISPNQISTLQGRDVYDRDGDKIGSVGQLYADAAGRPTWASVHTGLFGMNESLVPLHEAQLQGDQLQVPYAKSDVKDAPNVDVGPDEPLTSEQVQHLYRHYNIGWDQTRTDDYATGYTAGNQHTGDSYTRDSYNADGTDATYDTTRDMRGTGDNAMTRSEERLNVDTQREQTGTARLRKHVVTENVQTTVPVRHEQVRLEREPITDANRDEAYEGPDITESEHEVTLHAERPIVDTETVPVERVRLGKETVTGQQTVGGDVRKERIEADLPDEGRRPLR